MKSGAYPTEPESGHSLHLFAEAIVEMFGDEAPAIVRRQIEAAVGEAEASWQAISIAVDALLATQR